MPELPDVVVYVEALSRHVVGHRLDQIQLLRPFVLRSVEPPLDALIGRRVVMVRRLGKRIVLGFEADLFLVLHLMIAGRLRWRAAGETPGVGSKLMLTSLVFDNGTLLFTEASSRKRASMQLLQGAQAVEALGRGGVEPLEATTEAFRDALRHENHTLKRALTDPRIVSGIGNAYSDEILHAAKLSPLRQTRSLSDEDIARLHEATQRTLARWIDRLRRQVGSGFPERVTAFREEMAVHGRYRRPCPVCGSPVQRIVYADNECNYCARCQTGGRVLADRSLSRLLGADWPRSIDDINQ